MAYDGTRPRDDDFVKESAGIIRQNFEGLRTGGLVAPRPPLYGVGAPAATLGEAFDRYINTSTGDEYYKSSSGWVRVSNLGAIYKTSAGVYYTSATPDSSTGIVGDVCFCESSLSQKLYIKEASGWTLKTVIPKGSEKYQDMGTVSGTKNINAASGTIVKFTVAGSLTITLTATTESNHGCTLTLLMRKGGAYTVKWPTSVAWAGGITPTFSTTETDVVTLTTINGSDWVGAVAGAKEEEEFIVDTVIFTSSGTVTAPLWATKALITGCGGGGGGGADSRWAAGTGSAGDVTSFGSLVSIKGGSGGIRATSSSSNGAKGADGGPVPAATISGKYGAGGNPGSGNAGTGGRGGDGGAVVNYCVDVIGGQTYAITIGQGGAGGPSDWDPGKPGASGMLMIKWVA